MTDTVYDDDDVYDDHDYNDNDDEDGSRRVGEI